MTSKSPSNPNAAQAQARFLEGWAHHQKGRVREAWTIYQDVLKLHPRHFNTLHMAGIIAAQSHQLEVAVDLFGRAVEADPNNTDAHFNRGNALREFNQPAAAVASFDEAIKLRPGFAEAHNNRGNALKDLRNFEAAIESYGKAIGLKAGYTHAYYNRGRALTILKRYQDALESFEKAVRLNPSFAEALHECGQVQAEMRKFQAAIDYFDKAIRLKPDYAEAFNGRGAALMELKQYDAALTAFDKAISHQSNLAEAYINRGNVRAVLKRHAEASADFERALALDPKQASLHGARLHAKMHICDWRDHEPEVAAILARVAQGEMVATPFQGLTFTDSPALHRAIAELWASVDFPLNLALPPIASRARLEKIRVGYFSMDFRHHPVAGLVAGLIENHDRSRFEVYGFSYGPDTGDTMRKRLEGAFDKFMDVRELSDTDVAALARQMEIDIAVDLGGFTNGARTGIFALQAALIQVNYLGYPGTMGAPYYDYIVADRTVAPADSVQHYAEKIAYLPHSYQPNDTSRIVGEQTPSRSELGLPPESFVFCCFNNNFKITPDVFDVWMRILKRVDASVLWLLEDNPTAAANLRSEAARRGVAPERLVFAPRAPQAEHLARHRAADLFLDTLPYTAHTSASDALWTGLPLLTCEGKSFAGRVAASILTVLGLPELICTTPEDYEARAVALATNRAALNDLTQRLLANRLTAPLFNAGQYARGIEDAYTRMFECRHAGLPPDVV